jgi:hypothetical protein
MQLNEKQKNFVYYLYFQLLKSLKEFKEMSSEYKIL